MADDNATQEREATVNALAAAIHNTRSAVTHLVVCKPFLPNVLREALAREIAVLDASWKTIDSVYETFLSGDSNAKG